MGRYIGASCRRCRTLGEKLFLKAKKCGTAKCMLDRRKSKPGQHGKARKKVSEYSVQLTEKQKLRNMYGIGEQQFKLMFNDAARMKGITGHNLLLLLERRLDNVVMRIGFAGTRKQARQLVRHSHIKINGKRADIPSILVKQGDKITVSQKDNSKKIIKENQDITAGRTVPQWLKVDAEKQEAEIKELPKIEDIDHSVNVQLIVELYSK